MVRIEGTNLPQNKRLEYALTYIFGIGLTSAKDILNKLSINFDIRVKNLTDEEVAKIQKEVAAHYTRRFFGGRQPLCGNGVTSRKIEMRNPAD